MATRRSGRGAPNVDPPKVAAPAAPKARPAAKRSTGKPAPAAPTGAEDLIEKAFSLHSMAKAMGRTAPIDGFFKQVESILGPEEAAAAFRARGMEPPAAPAPAADAPPTNIPAGDKGPVTSADGTMPTPPRQQAAKPRAQSQADAARDARMTRAGELEKRDPDGFAALKKQGWSAEAIGNMDDETFSKTVTVHLGDRTADAAPAAATPAPQAAPAQSQATASQAQQAPAPVAAPAVWPDPPAIALMKQYGFPDSDLNDMISAGSLRSTYDDIVDQMRTGKWSPNAGSTAANTQAPGPAPGATGANTPPPPGGGNPPPPPPPPPGGGPPNPPNNSNNPFASVNWSQYQNGQTGPYNPFARVNWSQYQPGATAAAQPKKPSLIRELLFGKTDASGKVTTPGYLPSGFTSAGGPPGSSVTRAIGKAVVVGGPTLGLGWGALKLAGALGGAKNMGGGAADLVEEAWTGKPADPDPPQKAKKRYASDSDPEEMRRILRTPMSELRAQRNTQPAP